MLHTKEKTVSNHARQSTIKAGAARKSASGQSHRNGAWSHKIDQHTFGYASVPSAVPAKGGASHRKPTTAQNSRLARSEARLMTAAIGATMTICTVLVLYLCSYAHIASLGMREAQARVTLRQAQSDNETLLAQYATLRSPQRISAAAKALNMQSIAPTVSYIYPSRTAAPVEADTSGVNNNVSTKNTADIKVADRGTGEKPESTGTF